MPSQRELLASRASASDCPRPIPPRRDRSRTTFAPRIHASAGRHSSSRRRAECRRGEPRYCVPLNSIGTTSGRAATCLSRAANAFLSSRSSTARAGSIAVFILAAKSSVHFFQCPYSSFRLFAERLSRAGQPRFHRMLADPQYPRDFRHADLFDVLEDQHFAILGPKLGQSAIEFPIRTRVVRSGVTQLSEPCASGGRVAHWCG